MKNCLNNFESLLEYMNIRIRADLCLGTGAPQARKATPIFQNLLFIAFLQYNFQKPMGAWVPTAPMGTGPCLGIFIDIFIAEI